jgi:uncharacterized protein YycO
MTVRIGFVMQPDSVFSHLIKLVAGCPIHAAIFLPDGSVLQAEANGVELVPNVAHLIGGGVAPTWRILDVPEADASKLTEIVQSELGCPYDYWALLYGWTLGIQSDSKWFCSELAAYALMIAGVILKRENAAKYTPRRLYTELLARYDLHE